jgi:hypothetical protein
MGDRGVSNEEEELCTCCRERPAEGLRGVGPHEHLLCHHCARAWYWGWSAMISEVLSHLESLPGVPASVR